jgi:alanine racemase
MFAVQSAQSGPLLVSGPSDIHGSVVNDTIVERNCSLHVRGNLVGSLTIERGASVVVEGSIEGKIINRGGTLIVNNKGLAACVTVDGPPEALACGVLSVNLTALAENWDILVKRADAECAAVLEGNAFGCGLDPIASALAKIGCKTFFVSNLPEAKRVRAVAPDAVIYVLNGMYSGTGPIFAEINARPVINSPVQMVEWDAFVTGQQWTGGFALNVDTGERRHGFTLEDAASFAQRIRESEHGLALVMSSLDHDGKPDHPATVRQVAAFREVRRLYPGVPASLVGAPGMFAGPSLQFDLVRVGGALLGINPTPGAANPMVPVIELRARIVQVSTLAPGEAVADGWAVKRPTKLAWVSVGAVDGYPRPAAASDGKLQVIVGGKRCAVVGPPSMDLLPVDVTDVTDTAASRFGAMVTLIGAELPANELAAAAKTSVPEVLGRLGNRFHRVYYAI